VTKVGREINILTSIRQYCMCCHLGNGIDKYIEFAREPAN